MQFYRHKLPKFNEYVMVKITGYNKDMGVQCELLEYNNYPAVILNSEISKYKVNYTKKFPVGKIIPCAIYIIDDIKQYVNLSCRNMGEELIKKIEDKYIVKCQIYKLFHEIETDNLEYIKEMIWNCFTYIDEKEDHEYSHKQYYEMMLDNPNLIFNFDKDNIFSERQVIIDKINSRVKKTDITSELHFSLLILENGFVSNIKKLLEFEEEGIKLNNVSSPIYSIQITSKNLEDAKEIVVNFFDKLKEQLNVKYNLDYDMDNLKVIHERQFYYHYSKMI